MALPAPVFLDHQAGSPLSPRVLGEMLPLLESSANPASLHREGLRAREALALARERVARLIGAAPREIVFTSGGTEAANLALLGHARARGKGHLLLSATEHPAVLRAAERLEREGFAFSLVPVDATGRVTVEALAAAVRPETILAAVHWVNHEIGTIAPVAALATWCHERGIALFTDACAAAGFVPVDVREGAAPVSFLSLAAHRFGGPKGAGALYVRGGSGLDPLLLGGDQESGLRAGTENVAGIVGMGAAADEAAAGLPERIERLGELQRDLLARLRASVPGLELNGPEPGPERSAQNLNVSPFGIEGEAQALLCDVQGLAISAGAACVSRELRVSRVLRAIGLDADRAQAAVLFTLGLGTRREEVERGAAVYAKVVAKLRDSSPRWNESAPGK